MDGASFCFFCACVCACALVILFLLLWCCKCALFFSLLDTLIALAFEPCVTCYGFDPKVISGFLSHVLMYFDPWDLVAVLLLCLYREHVCVGLPRNQCILTYVVLTLEFNVTS